MLRYLPVFEIGFSLLYHETPADSMKSRGRYGRLSGLGRREKAGRITRRTENVRGACAAPVGLSGKAGDSLGPGDPRGSAVCAGGPAAEMFCKKTGGICRKVLYCKAKCRLKNDCAGNRRSWPGRPAGSPASPGTQHDGRPSRSGYPGLRSRGPPAMQGRNRSPKAGGRCLQSRRNFGGVLL